ncbi:MAG: T9SS type A sorting domain-containing protein [Candidatus Celaenobacter antarcticus]|nr:T9SS type A sorting domain-containing protein [Candidatus Celaenobacter antarcticus]
MKKMLCKEIILALAVSLFFCSMVFAGPNENAGIRFDLDATTYGNQNQTSIDPPSIGDYIRVDIYAINVHNLDTYEFEVNYNPSQLEYITASATNPITYEPNILTTNGGTALGWMIDNSIPGVLSIAYTLAGTDTLEAPEGEGLIADIVFQVSSTIGDSLTFGDVHFYDSFGVMDIITDKSIAIIPGSVPVDNVGFDTIYEENRLENYPNPVKSYTTIAYAIRGRKKSDEVEIKIYNIVGQLVDTIEARYGTAVWDGGDLPSGIYFYKLDAMGNTLIKKMLLLR